MKVIALYGAGGTGKTTTLNLLNNLINPDNPATNLRKDDRYDPISYKGKQIVITTPGDNKKEIEKNIEHLEDKNCDILVTASRTWGQTVTELKNFSKNIRWIKKNLGHKRQDLVNEAQALDLQAIIDEVINQLNAKEASSAPTP